IEQQRAVSVPECDPGAGPSDMPGAPALADLQRAPRVARLGHNNAGKSRIQRTAIGHNDLALAGTPDGQIPCAPSRVITAHGCGAFGETAVTQEAAAAVHPAAVG